MSLAVIDRRNQTILRSVPVPDEKNPHLLPPHETAVWHYVRFDYFQTLLKNKALYFTRMDRQSDKTDGNYSGRNFSELTPTLKALVNPLGFAEGPNPAQLLQTNQNLRKLTFVHCWSIRPRESAWMWDAFLGGEKRSVAIRTTIRRLKEALSGRAVDFSRIIYYPRGIPRPDWSYSAPFLAKDKVKHREERELRLVARNDIGTDEAEFQLIPADTERLVGKVILHPSSTPEFQQEVRDELRRHSIGAYVARSQLVPRDLLAIAGAKR